MIIKRFIGLLCGLAFFGTSLASSLPAQAEQAPDHNGPGVARVSVVDGEAVVQRGDGDTQTKAVVNAPLLPGDYISTGSSSRAELQFDGETAVRLGGNVQARITADDPNNRAMQIADGTVEIGIVHETKPFQIDTPSVSVRAQQTGDYRITIDHDGATWVTARRGQAEVIAPNHTYDLTSGRTLVARGSAANPTISFASEVGFDSFDDFNAKRDDTMMAALNASPNVSPQIAGYDNLDQYGNWEDVAGYGQAWVPQQSSDWAPYQNGSWVWEGGYGWTWVGNEPWGWAPYHYGRWLYANGYGWAWLPPPYTNTAPAWSPALVGFFGFGLSVGGPGWGVSVGCCGGGYGGWGYPGIGWYPLGPYYPYYPWYPGWAWTGWGWGWPGYWGGWGLGWGGWGGGYYGTRVVNVTRINNYYFYKNMQHHGLTGTLRGNFEKGNFAHNISVDPRNISHMGTIRGAVPVTPSRANLGFGHAPSQRVAFSHEFQSPRFASNRAVAARGTFEQEQRSIAQAFHTAQERQQATMSRQNGATQARNTEAARGTELPRTDETRGSVAMGEHARGAAASDSWSRFSQERGEVRPAYANRSSYGDSFSRRSDGNAEMYERNGSSEARNPYGSPERSSYGSPERSSYPSYARNPYGSSERSSYGSSERSSYPSYAHNPYQSYGSYGRNSYPSYSRGSYPSYAHTSNQSYGSYGRNSYPSYSRGSYPSYSRGSYPSSGGGYHGSPGGGYHGAPSGGGGHPSGGGGSGGHGGSGRPPQ